MIKKKQTILNVAKNVDYSEFSFNVDESIN